jgi:hypothetical protein
MKVKRLYGGPDGLTHLEEIEIPIVESAQLDEIDLPEATSARGGLTRPIQVDNLFFNNAPNAYTGHHNTPWWTGPRIVVVLKGVVRYEFGNDESVELRAGDLMFADNFTGKGHTVEVLETPKETLHIALPLGFDIDSWRRA